LILFLALNNAAYHIIPLKDIKSLA